MTACSPYGYFAQFPKQKESTKRHVNWFVNGLVNGRNSNKNHCINMICEKQIFENCCKMLNRVSNYFLVWIWYTNMFIYHVKFNFLSDMLEGLKQKKGWVKHCQYDEEQCTLWDIQGFAEEELQSMGWPWCEVCRWGWHWWRRAFKWVDCSLLWSAERKEVHDHLWGKKTPPWPIIVSGNCY